MTGGQTSRTRLHRILALPALLTMAVAVLAPAPAPVSAAIAFSQCDSINNAAAATISCDVTIVNNLNIATGNTSSSTTVTTNICSPPTGPCIASGPTTTASTQLVTSVDQCNGSGNNGGSTVKCTVNVTNIITGNATTTPATVNQCNGSGTGGGGTMSCTPFPASTTGADVTQCNGSADGGGTYNGEITVNCTVASGATTAAVLRVTINQCNGSSRGGGASVRCSANVTNRISSPGAGGTGTTGTGSGTPGTGTTGTGTGTSSSGSSAKPAGGTRGGANGGGITGPPNTGGSPMPIGGSGHGWLLPTIAVAALGAERAISKGMDSSVW